MDIEQVLSMVGMGQEQIKEIVRNKTGETQEEYKHRIRETAQITDKDPNAIARIDASLKNMIRQILDSKQEELKNKTYEDSNKKFIQNLIIDLMDEKGIEDEIAKGLINTKVNQFRDIVKELDEIFEFENIEEQETRTVEEIYQEAREE